MDSKEMEPSPLSLNDEHVHDEAMAEEQLNLRMQYYRECTERASTEYEATKKKVEAVDAEIAALKAETAAIEADTAAIKRPAPPPTAGQSSDGPNAA
ncbi:hypothetical protein SPRG_12540 [Saprolegnia parasitica CBS 223.65]|uniref:Uncharacterized protein n=1 Tax=Saprolegnia parasitica (strain CBS 223.65) TaxID=695850 RepID=A0A067C7N4_SAPPC|nr:hypothetical protein SPRG_12540 [Saprolegnia parasitica CBS 223.65]KDO22561.1 hypothetical protein SPRG_12540 [Saprolegnia parasitica CBS 223.65]|eukprot:XP_012206678.1 hypothetical protein SPRG_12540 [Saprolegnia parasitica CBS 223.65]